ncbi:MAG: tRNA pseudouridine(55) synthase TruB [Lachnospiraceae bacterium]|nr:tRNA pseudouridine(55) synthase TruB [Lachnospiraceae bacterium]
MDGIINVYKEQGYTSFDVVAKLRGILKERRIGHTGTLDPDAEGVLPVCIGSATKACELLLDKEKEYEAVLLLGMETDTQDISGKVLNRQPVMVDSKEAVNALMSFVGTYAQVPPMYSALKVNGRKLCDLARQGKTIERAPRQVTIYSIKVLDSSFSCGAEDGREERGDEEKTICFRVVCSKGTYIRTLCEDVGKKLGCGGCMKSLRRIRVSSFTEACGHTLGEIEKICAAGRVEEILMPVDRLFLSYPALYMRAGADASLYNGNKLREGEVVLEEAFAGETGSRKDGWFRVYDSKGHFWARSRYDLGEGCFRNVKMFVPGTKRV